MSVRILHACMDTKKEGGLRPQLRLAQLISFVIVTALVGWIGSWIGTQKTGDGMGCGIGIGSVWILMFYFFSLFVSFSVFLFCHHHINHCVGTEGVH